MNNPHAKHNNSKPTNTTQNRESQVEPHPDDLRDQPVGQPLGAARRENPRAVAEKLRERGADGHERVPLGGMHQKLTVRDYGGQLVGFVARWRSDRDSNIETALQAGYVPVYKEGVEIGDGHDYNPDRSTWVTKHGGTHEHGQPRKMYLMKIKKEWYEQDQAAKQRQIDKIDEAIRGDGIPATEGDGTNRYVKTADYSINSRRR